MQLIMLESLMKSAVPVPVPVSVSSSTDAAGVRCGSRFRCRQTWKPVALFALRNGSTGRHNYNYTCTSHTHTHTQSSSSSLLGATHCDNVATGDRAQTKLSPGNQRTCYCSTLRWVERGHARLPAFQIEIIWREVESASYILRQSISTYT